MVSAEDAIKIYRLLAANDIPIWLTGGWGIDALLGEQTRPHKDLDVLMLLDDVVRLRELLGRDGYQLHELWSENQTVVDGHGNKTATAFVLQDADGRQFDAHALRLDENGNGIPAWADAEDFKFSRQDLSGQGTIDGVPVPCISAESQVICHTGYDLPAVQKQDMVLLCEKFDLDDDHWN